MQYMMQDYTANYAGPNVYNKLLGIPGIASVQQLDYLTGNQLLMVQRDPMTASVLMGMDLRTVQWSTDGGETINFRVMAMMVPLMKTDQNSKCGIVHFTGNATTA
jgi:hypothetical protein